MNLPIISCRSALHTFPDICIKIAAEHRWSYQLQFCKTGPFCRISICGALPGLQLLKGWVPMDKIRAFGLHAVVCLLFVASASAQVVVTGDSRTVTEPVFPPVCAQLSAAITEVNNDIPTSVDAVITNPDA